MVCDGAMSQQTPSRRRPVTVETPGSARSTTSTTDRATLQDRVEDLDLQVHDLRRQIAAERQRRRTSTAKLHASSSTSSDSQLAPLDPHARRNAAQIQEALRAKLKQMDDDALTALLTASNQGVARWISQTRPTQAAAWCMVDAHLVPSKSVGVEGTGSGSDIDRRQLLLLDSETGDAAPGTAVGKRGRTRVQEALREHKHAASVHAWLQDRQRRSSMLLEGLRQFSYLEIDTLEQTEATAPTGGANRRSRSVHISGNMAKLFPLSIHFEVVEEESGSCTSPQMQKLKVTLPDWLVTTLDTPSKVYSKLMRRNDLPAILLMLRTMIPLLSLRRNVFTALMEQYTDLVREHVRAWETEHGLDFTPYHAGSVSSSHRTKSWVDEALGRSLIVPSVAETLVLQNKSGASLTLGFSITWNRYGHATPHISATPHVPSQLSDSTSSAFLRGFHAEFQHLLTVAIAQNAIVGLPDYDDTHDDQLDPAMGRWGIMPALHATINAFFALDPPHSDHSDHSSS